MKKIALVIPYFGTLPGYFPLWLMSCRYNPEMDFLIFTDDRRPFDWPENVKTVYMTWEEMQGRIRGAFDFPAAISKPYKLCDYRNAHKHAHGNGKRRRTQPGSKALAAGHIS